MAYVAMPAGMMPATTPLPPGGTVVRDD
jgi:hypothetical protein